MQKNLFMVNIFSWTSKQFRDVVRKGRATRLFHTDIEHWEPYTSSEHFVTARGTIIKQTNLNEEIAQE
jgi:hypothetical protein